MNDLKNHASQDASISSLPPVRGKARMGVESVSDHSTTSTPSLTLPLQGGGDKTHIIRCRDLRKTFAQGTLNVPVLNGVNLDVQRGERIALIGASGSGKSTLLHLLGGLDHASSGSVSILGQDVLAMNEAERGKLRNQSLGFVYQFHHLLAEFTALENVAMPLLIRGMKRTAAEPIAAQMLEWVGLAKRIGHLPAELSGGERQRVAVARALVTQPACVLADEPTGNLDRASAAALFDLMQSLNEKLHTSFIVVTHDLELAARMQRQLRLVDGVLQAI